MSTESKTKPLVGLTCRFDEDHDWYYLPADYSRAVAEAGGAPVQVPLIPSIVSALVTRLDAVVLCGSASDVDPARYGQGRHPEVKTVHPDRDESDFRILEQAFREKKPVLAICFGMQSLNVYLQGTLLQHIPQDVPGALDHRDSKARHGIFLEPGSRIAGWAGGVREIVVNSTHHQAIQKPGRGLSVAARAPDGVIEAVEGDFPRHFVMGVQWHPERIWRDEEISRRLFSELVREAAEAQR
jgi:putative glutamine amidotransferase